MMARKKWFYLAAAVMGVLLIAAAAQAANQNPKGQVVIGALGDIETLNPLLSENATETDILNGIFENLLRVDDHGEFLPALATEVPTVQNGGISKDGKVYTFHLRKGVKWSDGQPFTSADVKFTWDLIMNDKVPVVSRSGYDKIVKMETPDPYTVKMYLKEVYAPFLLNWSGPGIVPKHILENVKPEEITKAGDFSRHPIGTGPFVLKEWKSGSYVMLEANKNYWGEGPYLEKVIWKVVPDSNTMLTQLKTGEIDIYEAQPSQVNEIKKISRVQIKLQDAAIYFHMTFNLKNPILADKRVRQALTYGLPRQQIVDVVLEGVGRLATAASITPTSWAFDKSLKAYPFDQKKAKALLAEAGWKDVDNDGILEKDGKKLSLEINTNSGNKTREQIEQIAQQYWKQIGVDLKIRNYEPATLFGEILENMKFDIITFAWVSPPDPDEYTLYHSKQIPSDANGHTGQNYASYVNPEVDKLLEAGQKTVDQAQRKKIYQRIQEIVHEDLPMMYVYYYVQPYAFPKNLENYRPSGTTVGTTWNIYEWKLK